MYFKRVAYFFHLEVAMKFFVHALFHHAVARIVLYSDPNRKCEPIREVLAYTGVCLNVSPLTAYALNYAVAIYPLVLILITIKLYDFNFIFLRYLCKPILILTSKIHSKSDIHTSIIIIDSFSTFFLLSYVKILSTSFELLIQLNFGTGNIIRVLRTEPSVEYFSKEHLPYGVIALVSL